MIRSQLHDYREDDPTWGFIAQLGAEQFTGMVQLGAPTKARLFVDEGAIYFAERDGDAPVQSRLVVRGALTPAQLARGGVFVDGTVSLARLFTREPGIDRHEVEQALERLTQEVLDEVGPQPVGSMELTPLRHHDTGIHEWARRIQPPVIRAVPDTPAPITRPVVTPAPITIAPPPLPPVMAPPPAITVDVTPDATPPVAPATSFVAPDASPFSAPPVAATAAPLPAPLPAPTTAPAAPVDELDPPVAPDVSAPEVEAPKAAAPTDRYTPADFSSMELPKLATKVVSVAELAAAQNDAADAAPAEAGDRYTPADFSSMELPKLATSVMSVSQLAAKLEEPEPAAEPDAFEADDETMAADEPTASPLGMSVFTSGPVPAIHAAPLPALPALHLGAADDEETQPDLDVADALADDDSRSVDTAAIDEFDTDPAAEPIAAWATPSQNLAALEIWEMVDTMLAAEHEDELVSVGGPTEHKGGRWRRGKKG